MPALSPVCQRLLLRLRLPPRAPSKLLGGWRGIAPELPTAVLRASLPFSACRSLAVAEGSLDALLKLADKASDEQRTHCWRTLAVLVQHTDSHEAVRSAGGCCCCPWRLRPGPAAPAGVAVIGASPDWHLSALRHERARVLLPIAGDCCQVLVTAAKCW
jgi:hypothetical protein